MPQAGDAGDIEQQIADEALFLKLLDQFTAEGGAVRPCKGRAMHPMNSPNIRLAKGFQRPASNMRWTYF